MARQLLCRVRAQGLDLRLALRLQATKNLRRQQVGPKPVTAVVSEHVGAVCRSALSSALRAGFPSTSAKSMSNTLTSVGRSRASSQQKSSSSLAKTRQDAAPDTLIDGRGLRRVHAAAQSAISPSAAFRSTENRRARGKSLSFSSLSHCARAAARRAAFCRNRRGVSWAGEPVLSVRAVHRAGVCVARVGSALLRPGGF